MSAPDEPTSAPREPARDPPPARPRTDGGPFGFAEVLPYAIVRLGARLDRRFERLMEAEGLTVRQFGILAQFAGGQSRTAAQIARTLGVAPQSVAPPLQALVEHGLLTRRPVPGRGRPVVHALTDAGRALSERVVGVARAEDARLTGHLSAAERRAMLAGLAEIADRVDREP